jgi:hypothetical protein
MTNTTPVKITAVYGTTGACAKNVLRPLFLPYIIRNFFCYEFGRGNILKSKPKSSNTIPIRHHFIDNNNKKFVRHFVNVTSGLLLLGRIIFLMVPYYCTFQDFLYCPSVVNFCTFSSKIILSVSKKV